MAASDSLNENHTTIIINVKDVNDLPPVFPETLYEKTLDEEMEAPYMMVQVVTQKFNWFLMVENNLKVVDGKW